MSISALYEKKGLSIEEINKAADKFLEKYGRDAAEELFGAAALYGRNLEKTEEQKMQNTTEEEKASSIIESSDGDPTSFQGVAIDIVDMQKRLIDSKNRALSTEEALKTKFIPILRLFEFMFVNQLFTTHSKSGQHPYADDLIPGLQNFVEGTLDYDIYLDEYSYMFRLSFDLSESVRAINAHAKVHYGYDLGLDRSSFNGYGPMNKISSVDEYVKSSKQFLLGLLKINLQIFKNEVITTKVKRFFMEHEIKDHRSTLLLKIIPDNFAKYANPKKKSLVKEYSDFKIENLPEITAAVELLKGKLTEHITTLESAVEIKQAEASLIDLS